MLYTSLRTVDESAWLSQPSASPLHHVFGLTGEFGDFGLFWGILMTSTVFVVIFVLI